MAAIKYLTGIDLTKQELQNATVHNLASAPANPASGQIYFNTVSNRGFMFNGAEWVGMDALGASMTAADIIDAINSSSGIIDADNLALPTTEQIITSINSGTGIIDADNLALPTTDQTVAAINAGTGLIDDDNLSTNANDAISKRHSQNTDTGTSSATFTIGTSGLKIKNSADTEIQLRNNGDTDYADLRVKNLAVEGTTTTINSNTVNIGDSNIVLNSDITNDTQNSNGGITLKRLDGASAEQNAQMYFDNSTGRWMTIGGPTSGLITAGVANKVVFDIENAVSASGYVLTHNLNTKDVIVSIRDKADDAQVYTDVVATNVNSITVTFNAVSGTQDYSVTVIG